MSSFYVICVQNAVVSTVVQYSGVLNSNLSLNMPKMTFIFMAFLRMSKQVLED